jgi:predicted methyltransferase
VTASAPLPFAPRPVRAADSEEAQRALAARLNLQEVRGWRLRSLQWAVGASLPFWLQQWCPVLPGPLLWLAGLVEPTALVLGAGSAVLEHRWARVARMQPADHGIAIHVRWTARDDVRSALWYGLAVAAALPWMAWAGRRLLPLPVLSPVTLVALAVGGLFAASEAMSWRGRASLAPAGDDAVAMRRYRARAGLLFVGGITLVGLVAAGSWALGAVGRIQHAESDRDRWQRPADVVQALGVHEEAVVADLGSGVGYFTLKLSDRVGERGRVLAVDARALPLLLLRLRTALRSIRNVNVVHADAAAAALPEDGVDAVLVSNTFHELAEPQATLDHAFAVLRPGGRLVVVDPSERDGPTESPAAHPHASSASAVAGLRRAGFVILRHDEGFIDAQGQSWWLVVAGKPGSSPLASHR